METTLFYLFSIVALTAAIGVLVAPHPVQSVLYLVLVFCNGAGLLLLVEADVLALLFVVVYVGAIAVLFLFVVMMLDLKRRPLRSSHVMPILPAARVLALVFFGELVLVMRQETLVNPEVTQVPYMTWMEQLDRFRPLQPLGQVLYTHYLVHFLLAGLILLVALVGAIVLTLPVRGGSRQSKRQHVMHQMSRREDAHRFLTHID